MYNLYWRGEKPSALSDKSFLLCRVLFSQLSLDGAPQLVTQPVDVLALH